MLAEGHFIPYHADLNSSAAVYALSQHRKSVGPVVQLVRTPACHAGGREFESRPDRQKAPN